MKAKYIKPESEVVIVKLKGSVLDSIGLGGQSTEASDPAAKGNTIFEDEDEEDDGSSKNIWGD
jgi:hypothetical protein